MAFQGSVLVALLLVLAITISNFGIGISYHVLSRSSFPDGFVFGTASSAYQYEGAAREDGKGLSIWDNFTHQTPAKIANNSNGDVAIDFYNRYKEDVKLIKYIGLDAFRFSISWSRLLPFGKLGGGINKEGLAFYNNLINELLANGIQPFVTLFHWDLPQALEDEYGGFLSPRIVDDFRDFAELCFKEFGDRVNHWITLNEPLIYTWLGYDIGMLAPGRCSSWRSRGCPAGDSATEPYIVGHHLLLAHAAAFKIYNEKYQVFQKGQIGISLQSAWMVPSSNAQTDIEAANRALEFSHGWFMQPLTFGEYPTIMRKIVGNRLPEFSNDEAELVKGSFDFVGLNYYSAFAVSDIPSTVSVNISYTTDSRASQTPLQDKKLKQKGVTSVIMYPQGLKEILVYTMKTYGDPTIYITENGMADTFVSTVQEGVNDFMRVYFYERHLLFLREAIKEGVRVKGFLAWSFLDNFEWANGYNSRFGIGYVDYNDGLKRYLKVSALWFKKLLNIKVSLKRRAAK